MSDKDKTIKINAQNRTYAKPLTTLAVAAALATSSIANVQANDSDPDDDLTIDISLNLDSFFGFVPFLGATYKLDDGSDTGVGIDLTAYGIQWGAGTASDWGAWTEFGFGLNFAFFEGQLQVNPQIGFTFGNLLSSGAAEPGIVGDGIVPNLTVNLDTEHLEGEAYFGFYAPLLDNTREGGTTLQYIHWWTNLGYKFHPNFSFGMSTENLYLSGGSNASRTDGYWWVGPYVQVAKNNAGMRFGFGADLDSRDTSFSFNDYYKLSFFYSF